MDVGVRVAESRDLSELVALESEARHRLRGVRGGDRWLADRPELGANWSGPVERSLVLVATIDDVVVGFLLFSVEAALARVDGVYVTPGAREVGCGDWLLERALEAMVERGATHMDAEALPGDRETKNLYERAGIKARLITVSASLSDRSGRS